MSNPLVIRADANSRIGTGHVMRCIALGQAWQDAGGEVVFVSCLDSDWVRNRITDEGFALVELQHAYTGGEADLKTLVQISGDSSAKWIVADGYHFDLAYQRSIRNSGFKLLAVDDYKHLSEYEADILLNQNIGSEGIVYNLNPDCRQFLGLNYVMLRREFRRASAEAKKPSASIRNILVTMGGSDPDNAALDVINMFGQLGARDFYVRVLVGASNMHASSLRDAVKVLPCKVEIMDSVMDMPGLIRWADFAVSAAGSTCWELAAMAVPFMTVVLAENQERVALLLERTAGVRCAGISGPGLQDRLLECCREILLGKSGSLEACVNGISGLVDAWGVDRILNKPAADSGLNLYNDRLSLRTVRMSDADILLDWANDGATRSGSFNSKVIDPAEHVDWLKCRIGDPGCLFLLAELDGVPFGEVRYDMIKPGEVLMSFTIAPSFRGMGLCGVMVESSLINMVDRFGESVVQAYSLPGNIRAHAVLAAIGFVFNDEVTEYMDISCLASSRTVKRKDLV